MKKSADSVVFNTLGYIILIFLALLCVLPFLLIISGSFTDNYTAAHFGFAFWPSKFSLEAYNKAFQIPGQIYNAYKTTIIVTTCGTVILLILSSMTGYVLSRKDYKYRNVISFYFFFTTIFSGGLVPWYILCNEYLKFADHPLVAMVVPGLFSYFYIIIMRSFISGIPDSISESAKIDGANDFDIFIRFILPLSKPVLATVGLFAALGYWNDWYNAMLFVKNDKYYPLQYFLYMIINRMNTLNNLSKSLNIKQEDVPTETFKLAITVISTGPIILLYPFLQKYFIRGMMIGAVKG
jgi:putative aldouronate transport system permease protein